jgi:hypothetical protein
MSGIVGRAKLFQRILYSYANYGNTLKSVLSQSDNMPKAFNRLSIMRQNSSGVQGEHGDFGVVLVVSEYAKYFSVQVQYAERI